MDFPFPETQMEFVLKVSHLRGELLDPLFAILRWVDTFYFTALLILIIWLGFSYRWGMRILLLATLNSFLNGLMKQWVDWPRPDQLCPGIAEHTFHGGGFPSGGAQSAFLIGCFLIYYWKNKWAWPIGISLIFLLSFARIYLGAHFPIDILGGWMVGALLFVLFIHYRVFFESWLKKQSFQFLFILIFLASLVLICDGGIQSKAIAVFFMGTFSLIGIKYNLYLSETKNILEAFRRTLFGVSGGAILLCTIPSGWFAYNVALPVWIALIASPLFNFFFGKNTK